MVSAGCVDDEMSVVEEMLNKLGRHSDLYAEVKRCVDLKRIFKRLRLGAAPEEAVGNAISAGELEGLLSRLCFSASYAPKLSASTKMGLLDAFIDDVEPAWDWKAFLEASSTSELRALYRQDDSRLYHELVQTRGERAAVLALLPRHSLALEWECEHLQVALELLSCDEIERRTLLLSCFEEEKELLVEGGGHQRALRNLLLQLTRERRPGDDDFDSMCLERAEKLRERATESEAVVAVDLLDHFTASCSKPMRGEESPVKAAQALQFGAEVKELFPEFEGDLDALSALVSHCRDRPQFECLLRLADSYPPEDERFADCVLERALQCSDPQVICYVAEQCASAIRLEVDQLLRAADRCVQLGSPTVAFELCLMDRTGATDSKAREVAKLLGEDTASEVAAALGTAHRRSSVAIQAPAISLLESSPAYAAVVTRVVEDRTLSDSALVGGGVASRFLRRVLDGVPAALNVLSVNLLSEDVDLGDEQ